jgi:glycogen debranching enzyme
VHLSDLVNLSETTVIKAGNAFCVALRDGRLPRDDDHPLGIYLADCRHLRGYELRIAGREPRLLISNDSAGSAAVFELTNQNLTLADGRELPLQSLQIRLDRQMRPASMLEQISLRSHARDPVGFELELRLDADFSPMLEVRGLVQPTAREVQREARGNNIRFAATGIDRVVRSTTVSCSGAAAHEDGSLRVPVELEPGEEISIAVEFELSQGGEPARSGIVVEPEQGASMSRAGADAEAWLADRCRVEVDEELVDRVLRRSLLDLRLLASELDGHRYYAAGVPWYATLFGRDSIIAALQTLPFDPHMAAETLRVLADRLGETINDERDEEPGKVLHELRQDELAVAGLTPFARYYGTVDATPLFLCLLCEHANWTGSLDVFHELQREIDETLRWIDEFGDLDGDHLLEYRRRSADGLANHCWKDSWDGIPDEHGMPLEGPVAVVEVQGYVVAAKRGLARLFELDGDSGRAQGLRRDATDLAEQIERFWLPELGHYAIGLDGGKRASRVLASNQGHLLWAGAVPRQRAGAVCSALMRNASYSGWGVRTLGCEERAFNPVGYHTGTVWPHDNALFAVGLRRYGLDQPFLQILEGLLDAASVLPDYRLPELFAGFSRADYEDPVPYPVACMPQAWAAGSLPAMLIAGLGITADGLQRTLRVRRPSLPRHVNRVAVERLRIGEAHVDLVFERVAHRADSVALTDVKVDGQLDVVLEILRAPDPETRPTPEPGGDGSGPRVMRART